MPSPVKITALASLVMVDLYRRRDLLVAFILAAVILVPLASAAGELERVRR